MSFLEWLIQFDWLLGVVSTEAKTLRERKRRKTDSKENERCRSGSIAY